MCLSLVHYRSAGCSDSGWLAQICSKPNGYAGTTPCKTAGDADARMKNHPSIQHSVSSNPHLPSATRQQIPEDDENRCHPHASTTNKKSRDHMNEIDEFCIVYLLILLPFQVTGQLNATPSRKKAVHQQERRASSFTLAPENTTHRRIATQSIPEGEKQKHPDDT